MKVRPAPCGTEPCEPVEYWEVYVVSFDLGQSDNAVYVGVGAENVVAAAVVAFVVVGEGDELDDDEPVLLWVLVLAQECAHGRRRLTLTYLHTTSAIQALDANSCRPQHHPPPRQRSPRSLLLRLSRMSSLSSQR